MRQTPLTDPLCPMPDSVHTTPYLLRSPIRYALYPTARALSTLKYPISVLEAYSTNLTLIGEPIASIPEWLP